MQIGLEYTDILKLEEEVVFLTGDNDYKIAANYLLRKGVKLVLITLG